MLPETLEWLRHTARQGQSYSLAHLDHVERLDALEARVALLEQRSVPGAVELAAEADEPADDEAQTRLGVLPEILDTLRRAIREPMAEPLSPAQAVKDAVIALYDDNAREMAWSLDRDVAAVVIRALADQAGSARHWHVDQLRSIAAELEGGTTTPTTPRRAQ
jgi:hypothetical protein